MWFNNYTFIPGPPTMAYDSPLRTYPSLPGRHGNTPWFAPGSAGPIHSPCGVGGGNPYGCPAWDREGNDCPGGGYGFGDDARVAYMNGQFNTSNAFTMPWAAGSEQDVLWNIKANHGGGYAYRLCRVPVEGVSGVTEACFQQGHLEFAGDKSWAQWGPSFQNRTEFTAQRTSTGTWPPNSQWTKNPIPACRFFDGGFSSEENDDCEKYGFQFEPPAPGLHGYGEHNKDNYASTFGFNIVDKVKVPADLEPGKYVLSFRWDCEQTPQVWNTCADIMITANTELQPPKEVKLPQKILRTLDYANGL